MKTEMMVLTEFSHSEDNPLLWEIDYVNYRGERSRRKIMPYKIWFGTSPYHGDVKQFFLKAMDERREIRDFAMKDMIHISME